MVDSRLAFDILARDDGASAVFDKVARAADRTGASLKKNSKISAEAAKLSAVLTKARVSESNALDKVQLAESKLSNVRQTAKDKATQVKTAEQDLLTVRNSTSSTTSQIAAAESKLANARSSSRNSTTQVLAGEKALAKARREAASAGNVAQKAAKDLGKVLDVEGKSVAKRAGSSVLHWFTGLGKDVEKAGAAAGSAGGNGFLSALTGVLKTPVLGPAVIVGLIAAVTAAATPVGAVVAGAIVTGAGAGLAALGVVFAAKSAVIKSIWSKTAADLGAQMRSISKPFESTLSAMSVVARRTFAGLKPQLAAAFKSLAPELTAFGDSLGRALEKLGPALQPLAGAFGKVLGSLGPAMNDLFSQLSTSLTKLSASISKNPTALADFVRGIGGLAGDLIGFVGRLNDADAAFKRFTGGTSAVTALMWTLRGAVAIVTGPIDLLARGLSAVGDGMNWMAGKLGTGSQAMDQAGASTTTFSSSLFKAAAGLTASANAGLHAAHATHAANTAALLLAGAYDRQWAATQKANQALMQMSGLLLTLSGSEIAYQQAVDDVTAAVKANGKTHDINTQKGRDNKTALDQSAASANAQTINLRNSNKASVAVAIAAQREYAKQAQQMGYTATQAHRMAQEFVNIPKKTKADFKVDITDLSAKVATAKKQLTDPHLSATKKAKLTADIVQWQAGIAAAKRSLAGLPVDRTAKLKANKADLEAKIKSSLAQLANPNLSATKTAKLKAEIANARAGIATINGMLNGLPASKTVKISINTYKNMITTSSVGGVPAGIKAPGKAVGGPVKAGSPYLIGEKGPELMVPSSSGTIIPNNALKTGMSVGAGLAQGMLGSGGAAISAAGQVAAGMIAKAKQVLGIASPSKAFAQLGLWVNQGFSIGLKGSAKQVQSAMASLMSKVLNISFNAADTKKSIQKTITSLNAALSAAKGRIKPVTGNSKQRASAERGNRQAEASIRSIQAKLKSAYTDLANVNAIANRLGTTVKRNAVLGMLQRENVAMQKLANQRAAVANQLKAAQTKLAGAIQVRDDFKKAITDSALAFNAITNVQAPDGEQLSASNIIAQMTETLRKTQAFAASLARLKAKGINSTIYKQIAEAGVEQGGAIADALLNGGPNTMNSINRLQANINSAASGLGNTAAANMYQAGVDAAQGLVNGLLAKTKALDAASKKLAAAIVAQIKKTLGIHSPSKVMEWHGSMAGIGFSRGIEGEVGRVQKASAGLGAAALPGSRPRRAAVPANGTRGGGDIYITVNGALDPNAVALQIQQLLKRYTRTGGGLVSA